MSRLAQDQDESELIAAKVLGDMRNATLIRSPNLHPPSISCAYIPVSLTSYIHSPFQPLSPRRRSLWPLRPTPQL